MKSLKQVILFSASAFVLTACAPSNNGTPKRQADADVTNSIKPASLTTTAPTTATEGLGQTEQGLLTIQKSALGKAFMMSPSVVIADSSPILDHLQPIVIAFEKSGDQLGLFELNLQAYYEDLPVNKLLQTFDIASEDDKQITFRWKYGLSFLTQKDLSQYSEFGEEENGDPGKADETVIPVVASFVRSLKVQDNALFIEQVSRVRSSAFVFATAAMAPTKPTDVSSSDATIQLNVRISPYKMNPNFKPRESELAQGIGFFEQFSWNLKEQRKVIQAKRWDFSPERGPVTYAITKNTPAEYVETVKEGILYWNRVMGREIVRVETGVDPREPARDRRVLVHWIDWLDAGFARAGMQSDPFTGELLGANVYMTSVFVNGGRTSARQENRTAKPVRYVGMTGFHTARVCDRELDFDLTPEVTVNPTEEMTKQVARDYVRSTVAHEVGHTMGLRHNFAGTLVSQIATFDELRKVQKQYLAGQLKNGAVTTSTVMDYDSTLESALSGARLLTEALPYDRAAMEWGYIRTDAKVEDMKVPPFCTDGHLGQKTIVVGCQQFDSGREPLIAKSVSAKIARDNFGVRFMRFAITLLRPLRGPKPTVREFYQAVNKYDIADRLNRTLSNVKDMRTTLLTTAESQQTRMEIGLKGWENEEAWTTRNTEVLKKGWTDAGGLPALLDNALPLEGGSLKKGWLLEQVQGALATDEARAGITLDGVVYELTVEERNALKAVTENFAKTQEDKYVTQVLKYFNITNEDQNKQDKENVVTFNTKIMADSEETKVVSIVSGILTASDKTAEVKVGATVTQLAVPRHSLAIRLLAINLLSPKNFAQENWTQEGRKKLVADSVARLKGLGLEGANAVELMLSAGKVDLNDDSQKLIGEELQLLKALEALGG